MEFQYCSHEDGRKLGLVSVFLHALLVAPLSLALLALSIGGFWESERLVDKVRYIAVIVVVIWVTFLLLRQIRNDYLFETRRVALDRNGILLYRKGEMYRWSEVSLIAFGATSGKQHYATEICIAFRPLTAKDLKRLCWWYEYGSAHQKHFILLDYSEALLKEIQDLSGLPVIDHRPEQLK